MVDVELASHFLERGVRLTRHRLRAIESSGGGASFGLRI
jgi:hypothetical protein